MILKLRSTDHGFLLREARKAQPNECCGLITGTGAWERLLCETFYPSKNVTDKDPRSHFEIDPALQFDLLRETRTSETVRVIGHYHSHPNGPCKPSRSDLEQVMDPKMIWLICNALEVRAFDYDECNGVFQEREIILI